MRIVLGLLALSLTAPASAGEVCLVPSPNGINATVDCSLNPELHDNATTGYSTEGAPCEQEYCSYYFRARGGWREYGWSISASQTDPDATSGPLPLGITFLYLWLECTVNDGVSAVEMSLASDPDLILLAFQPMNGVLNVGTVTDLLMAVGGCPTAPFLAGEFMLLNTGPVSVEPETWGGIKADYR